VYHLELDSNAFFRIVKRTPEASRSVIKAAEASTVKGEALEGAQLEQHKTESGKAEGHHLTLALMLFSSFDKAGWLCWAANAVGER
jgi:hypothetical protein